MGATKLLHLLFIYLVLGEPVVGWLVYRRFLRRVAEEPSRRARYYRLTIVTMWALVALLALGAWGAGIPAAALGLARARASMAPKLGVQLSRSLAIGALVGALIGLLLPVAVARLNAGFRQRMEAAAGPVGPLLPVTAGERRLWVLLSLNAGLTEELLYRGFLFAYLPIVLPSAGFGTLLLVSSLVFGLAHTYQGVRGVLGTSGLGLVLALLYGLTGTLLAPALLHAVIDLRVLWLVPRARAAA